jgi:hypothetical protein
MFVVFQLLHLNVATARGRAGGLCCERESAAGRGDRTSKVSGARGGRFCAWGVEEGQFPFFSVGAGEVAFPISTFFFFFSVRNEHRCDLYKGPTFEC